MLGQRAPQRETHVPWRSPRLAPPLLDEDAAVQLRPPARCHRSVCPFMAGVRVPELEGYRVSAAEAGHARPHGRRPLPWRARVQREILECRLFRERRGDGAADEDELVEVELAVAEILVLRDEACPGAMVALDIARELGVRLGRQCRSCCAAGDR